MPTKNRHAVALGRKGGKVTSDAKAAAARANGRLGGAPKKVQPPSPDADWRTLPPTPVTLDATETAEDRRAVHQAKTDATIASIQALTLADLDPEVK